MLEWGSVGPLLITVALALGAVLFTRKFGGSVALESLERSNRVLTHRVTELESLTRKQDSELRQLRAKTDISAAVEPVLAQLRHHEDRAADRTEKILNVLGMIADRLAPDTD